VKAARPVSLKIITTDKPGILSNVSAAFTEAGVNIQEANCRVGTDGTAVNLFHFQVNEASKLQTLMRKIQSLDGVYSVERS
jgi:guanosine-3',5'-bis(diphosphate) 3'-pyrophosphohydrolase